MESARIITIKIVNVVGGIIGFFLAARILLELLVANPSTPIVSWIYTASGGLVYPFQGIFKNISFGPSILDMSAIVALVAYAILFSIITAIVNALATSVIYHDHTEAHVH